MNTLLTTHAALIPFMWSSGLWHLSMKSEKIPAFKCVTVKSYAHIFSNYYNLYRVCLWTTQLLNNRAVHYYHILYLLIYVRIYVILVFSEYIVTSWFLWNLTSWTILYFLSINHIISSCAFNKSVYSLLLKRMCPPQSPAYAPYVVAWNTCAPAHIRTLRCGRNLNKCFYLALIMLWLKGHKVSSMHASMQFAVYLSDPHIILLN